MESRKRKRCIYVNARQKKKLIELMANYPELISCKVTQDFNYKDSQKLWQNIASECNAIGGARKTWRQWRKTWHDIRSKTKKRQAETNSEHPLSTGLLSVAEQETLGINSMSATDNYEEIPEFVAFNDNQPQIFNEQISRSSISESISPPEPKFYNTKHDKSLNFDYRKHSSKNGNTCYFNCDLLAVQEDRKVQIKKDYINFKKDYLRQKLVLLKEQTQALKSIAKELSK